MPIFLALNRNIAIVGRLQWRGLWSTSIPKGSMKALNEGELKTKSKISIGTNLHHEGIV